MEIALRVQRARQGLLDRYRTQVLFVGLVLTLIGSRALLIAHAANPTPFLDEWEADGARLLKPYLEGTLTLRELFVPLNEHLIVCTKLLVLAIYEISGYWDVVLQMIVNAFLDAVTIVAIAWALARVLSGGWAVAAMIVSTVLNALPYGYDNAVLGFNTHFYMLLALSFVSLWLLTTSRAWSLAWAAGALCAVASFLCMASGALTLAAGVGVRLLQIACSRRGGWAEWAGIAALAAITAMLVSLVPHVPEADALRAHSLGQFVSAAVALASWPSHTFLGLVFFAPSALFVLRILRERPALDDPRWLNVTMLGWVSCQILALAAGRAALPLQTRYSDLLLVGLTANIVSAFWLFQASEARVRPTIRRVLLLGIWLAFLGVELIRPQRHLPDQIEEWRTILATGEQNVRLYLATGDGGYMARKPAVEIPSFFPSRLRELLDMPAIRSALPPDLTGAAAPRPSVEQAKSTFIRFGAVWLALGFALTLGAIARNAWGRRAP